jgi:Flp pilus assembly CpaE family ATPase
LAQNISIDARSDWMQIGRSRVRVYRLSARLPGQLEVIAFVSRAGELLKIQLPDRLQLVNDAIVGH